MADDDTLMVRADFVDTGSTFVGVESHHWAGPGVGVAETHRIARLWLEDTGKPQGVHLHGEGAVCVTGCYVIRWAE